MDYAPRPVDSRLRGNDGPVVGLSFSPSPLIPLPSRERGNMVGVGLFHPCHPAAPLDCGQVRNDGPWWVVVLDLFTLTFDSSPIKGEGECGWFVLFTLSPPCGFPPTRE